MISFVASMNFFGKRIAGIKMTAMYTANAIKRNDGVINMFLRLCVRAVCNFTTCTIKWQVCTENFFNNLAWLWGFLS